jgi:hypothetical protein
LPVRAGDRTVSELAAARNFCFIAALAMSSLLGSETEPHHTPSAPRARAAAICAPDAIPPAARTVTPRATPTISGVSAIVGDRPRVAAGLRALCDETPALV